METFWKLFRESIIVQSLVTLMLITTIIILVLSNRPVPDVIVNLNTLVVGFWFGTKVQHSVEVSRLNRDLLLAAKEKASNGESNGS